MTYRFPAFPMRFPDTILLNFPEENKNHGIKNNLLLKKLKWTCARAVPEKTGRIL